MSYRCTTIFLVGARASGKSTVGQKLAEKLGWAFVDTDALVQEKARCSVARMVEVHGWPHFRAEESLALRQAAKAYTVVATGGGMILDEGNRLFMRQHGLVFFLHVPAQILAQRLASAPAHDQRPSLTAQGLLDEVESILTQRLPLYRIAAHHQVDAMEDIPTVVDYLHSMILNFKRT